MPVSEALVRRNPSHLLIEAEGPGGQDSRSKTETQFPFDAILL
jgi:hypothetical protein